MDLEKLLNPEFQLCEDSQLGEYFGLYNQLEIVGWSGKQGSKKLYIAKCHICSKDSELFGEGYFRIIKSEINKGTLPCGCSKIPKWSKDQHLIVCSRKATELGVSFLGFIGEFKGAKTKCLLSCPKHGEYEINKISYLVNRDYKGCPSCKSELTSQRVMKPDNDMVESFMRLGVFHPDTKFWRSDRLNSYGYKTYWKMFCPVCGEEAESYTGSLQNGCMPCACKRTNSNKAYITGIYDSLNMVAIKFGVARSPTRRIKEQSSKTVYELRTLGVWEFPNEAMCLKAERECKNRIDCSVLPKEEIMDGYTETSYVSNIDSIISIYEEFGGLEI